MTRRISLGLVGVSLILAGCSSEAWRVEPQVSGVSSSLRGLSVVSDDIVWIGAPEGTILRTLNGGQTWQVMTTELAGGADLRSAHGFDEEHALFITAGQPARILATRDGGASFAIVWQDDSGSAFFDSLAFWDDQQGLAFSDPVDGAFLVLRTHDGGESWQTLTGLPAPLEGEAGFAASNSSIALTGTGCAFIGTGGGPVARVLRSCDHGEHWIALDTPIAAGSDGAGIFAVTASGPSTLAVSGGDYQSPESMAGTFAISRDNGDAWLGSDAPPLGYRSDIVRLWGEWIAVGTTGVDLGREIELSIMWRDSGWDIAAPNAVAISPSGETAWIIGAEGGIWRLKAR
ncbi:hypothetical protein [Maricaulis sp.]|uniref:WD40/YVTN/BNR-like repeat-containing protein n=1 Tax=Maricaulis sp. TaxID=1486257 RepID=UPI0025B9ED9C|nr:hypothetical protein [Maricaulis sp.]